MDKSPIKWNRHRIVHLRTEVFEVRQPEFARMLGTSVTVISRWENERVVPSPMAVRLLDLLEERGKKREGFGSQQ